MNRVFLIFTVALFYVSGAAFAQDTIKGKVVDRKGNPVVGTKITLKSGDIATTDFDGAFEIEASEKEKAVANCVGMQQKKVKMKDDMVIKLKKTTAWNRKPMNYSPFVMLLGGISDDHGKPVIGAMAGIIKNVGLYGKLLISTDDITFKTIADTNVSSDWKSGNSKNYWTTGTYYFGLRQLTIGGILRLGCPLHFCMGFGVTNISKCAEILPDALGKTHKVTATNGFHPVVDGGWMLLFKHFSLNLTLSNTICNYGGESLTATLGVGYKF